MGDLDGVWDVRRVSGALPPMVAVRKPIVGSRGATLVGPVQIRFEVRGHELHYGAPLRGVVDVLEPDGDGFRGRTRVAGVEVGQFELRRIDTMDTLKDQLVKHIDEALAMEQNVLRMLDSMISTTEDPEIREELREHKLETERHQDRMQQRLDAHGAQPSTVREAGGVLGALMKSVVDVARTEQAGRNARDAYATEHMEVASYHLLERIARKAGDEETAQAAQQNRTEDEAMAARIASHWDRFAELTLQEQGIPA